MNDSDFEGEPFKEPNEWRRLRRHMHEWDDHREVVQSIATVVSAAKVVKATMPWAIVAGGALLAYLNRAMLLGGGG